MSKHYRNYIGISTATNYTTRKELGGAANLFDTNLDFGKSYITGGTVVTPGNGYTYNVFTSPGTLETGAPPIGINVDILLVAGGGGGGVGYYGGGGGAGGVIYYPNYAIQTGFTTITIGNGSPGNGAVGSNSLFSNPVDPLVALGGGGGGPRYGAADDGGSGGGVGYTPAYIGVGIQSSSPAIPANSRTYGYGNPGGPSAYGSGGGGAGGSGQPGPLGGGGVGFNAGTTFAGPVLGLPALTTNGYFGGGGAGGNYPATSNPGGLGGGANADSAATIANTGGGGGGGTASGAAGGAGAPGICVIRYPDSLLG